MVENRLMDVDFGRERRKGQVARIFGGRRKRLNLRGLDMDFF